MFSWRGRRQFVVLVIFAVIITTLGIRFGAKLLPEPTCFDRRKNQGEVVVDCGGPCLPCELRNPKKIQIFWTRAASVRAGVYDVAAEIENPNEALSSRSISYEFILLDKFGPVVVRRGKTFALPHERLYVVETNLKTTRVSERVDFKILDVDWGVVGEYAEPDFVIERREYRTEDVDGKRESVAEATIANLSPHGWKEVEISFVILDEIGNMLGSNRVVIEEFLPDSRRVVRSMWPEELKGRVAKVEIEPRVNVFDPLVILKPQ